MKGSSTSSVSGASASTASTAAASGAHRRKKSAYGPTGPPAGVDEDHSMAYGKPIPLSPPTSPEMFATEEEYRQFHEKEKESAWHNFPLILVAIPPIGAIVHGRAEQWADAIILILVGFYLWNLIKVPWQIYYASHARVAIDLSSLPTATDEESSAIRRRALAKAKLRRNEVLSLLSTLVVPFVGAYLLHYVRGLLSDPDRYINTTIVTLFALATSVKPLLHFGKLVKNSSLYYQEQVHYPSSEVHFLRRRVETLENDLSLLSRAFATKEDIRILRDGVDVPLSQLNKAVHRFDKKEEYLRLSSDERFALLDARLEATTRAFRMQSEVVNALEAEHQRRTNPLATLLGILFRPRATLGIKASADAHDPRPMRNEGKQLRWYEAHRVLALIFWPVSVSNLALEWVGKTAELSAEAVERERAIHARPTIG